MSGLCSVFRHIDDHLNESIARLTKLCGLPSVGAHPPTADAIAKTAEHIVGLLRDLGFEIRITPRTVLSEAAVVPAADIGLDHPESGMHAPDEDIRIADFHWDAKAMAAMLGRFAEG